MKSKDKQELVEIYENLDFQSSYTDDFDPEYEKIKHKVDIDSHAIEKMLSGTIAYYRQLKQQFDKMPTDMTNVRDIQRLREFLVKELNQFSNFTN